MDGQRVITPTVGRVVLFWPKGRQQKEGGEQPCAAQVAHVHDDRKVNLGYMTPDGQQWPRVGVPLRQPDDEAPEGEFCEWMEFQVSQAAKTEDVIGKLADRFDRAALDNVNQIHEYNRCLAVRDERLAALEAKLAKVAEDAARDPRPI